MRLAAAPEDTPEGSPGDALFREAPAPETVVLGLAGDLERELEFVHRVGPAIRSCRWILVGDPERVTRARELFDLLPATYLIHPPEAAVLRAAIHAETAPGDALPLTLSLRRARDRVSERFARALADLDLPVLLRAIDPRLAEVPLLVLGEPGTGRGTLARYVHHFGGTAGGALIELPCTSEMRPETLLAHAADANTGVGAERAVTLWLAGPGALPPATQRIVSSWVRYGFPPGHIHSRTLRWIATDTGAQLDPDLRRNLSGLSLRLPALREQRERLPHLVGTTIRSWCQAHRVPTRRFDEPALDYLAQYPWPGNLHELEAVVEQSLAASASDPLGCGDLVLDGMPLDPTASATRQPQDGHTTAVIETVEASTEEILDLLGEEESDSDEAQVPAASSLGKLTAALGPELRSPLPLLQSFASLLSDRHEDPEFRRTFQDLVLANTTRAAEFAERLEALGELAPPQPRTVDVAQQLETALRERRPRIRARRLVVLEELDRKQAEAYCDPQQLELALETLLDEVIDRVPESGDVYLASRRQETGLRGGPCIRILIRYRGARAHQDDELAEATPATNALGFAIADLLVRAQNGTLTLDSGERGETLLLLDLPA